MFIDYARASRNCDRAVLAALVCGAIAAGLGQMGVLPEVVVVLGGLAIVLAIWAARTMWVTQRTRHARLVANRCAHCGFDMAGAESRQCVECGLIAREASFRPLDRFGGRLG